MEISKSDLMALRQCPKRLWLERHCPEGATASADAQRRARDGQLVGRMAREALGNVLWTPSTGSAEHNATQAAEALAAHAGTAAVEFPMFADGVYARADALIPEGDGYVLQETKACKFPLKADNITPDKAAPHLVEDVAVQLWVARASGVAIGRAELNLIDGDFIYAGDSRYEGFFRQLDVTDAAQELLPLVPGWVGEARNVLRQATPPGIPMGTRCKKPQDCPFMKRCQAEADLHKQDAVPVTLLPDRVGKALARSLMERGFVDLRKVPAGELAVKNPKTTKLHERIQLAHIRNQPVFDPAVAEVVRQIAYPRYYFDFEGIDLVVPIWTGLRPMEQVTFQWSCHIQREPGGPFEHHEFLDISGDDPTRDCLEAMSRVLPANGLGSIIVYYATYEVSRLKEMAMRQPEFAARIGRWIDLVVDLHPIVKDHYYHPKMLGSFSIKQVLKALAPAMDYAQLDEVHNGTEAQLAYLRAVGPGLSRVRRQRLRQNMLAYCGLDTWAMVMVAAGLAGVSPTDQTIVAPCASGIVTLLDNSGSTEGIDASEALHH